MAITRAQIAAKGIKKLNRMDYLLECISSGRYRIDAEKGIIYSIRKGIEKKKVAINLPTGYLQHILFRGKRDGQVRKTYYEHQVIWASVNGAIPEGMVIDHIDRNRSNNSIHNLRLTTPRGNVLYSLERPRTYGNDLRLIRGEEINKIRELMNAGCSQSSIARQLDLNRLSVRYVYNKIMNGEVLKFENK